MFHIPEWRRYDYAPSVLYEFECLPTAAVLVSSMYESASDKAYLKSRIDGLIAKLGRQSKAANIHYPLSILIMPGKGRSCYNYTEAARDSASSRQQQPSTILTACFGGLWRELSNCLTRGLGD